MPPARIQSPNQTDPIVPGLELAPDQAQMRVVDLSASQGPKSSLIDAAASTSASSQAEIQVAEGITSQVTMTRHIQSNRHASAPVADSTPNKAIESTPIHRTATGNTATILTTPIIPSHAHPRSSTSSRIEPETATDERTPISASSSNPASSPAPIPTTQSLIQFDTYEWLCFNQSCRKLTSPFDDSTVICPRCGPYSKVRYCSKPCLFSDLLTHWALDCGRYTLTQRADPLTIEARQINILPFLPSLTHIDRPERHRQLIRHSLDNTTADYFIFSDFIQWRADGCPGTWPAHKHASGHLVAALTFADNNTTTTSPFSLSSPSSCVPARHVFERLLRICFLIGGHRTDMTYFLFRMILGRLEELGWATADSKQCLVWQFRFEFGYEGSFVDMLMDERPVAWPLVATEILQLERQYDRFLTGRAGLGPEWTNAV